MSYGNIKDIETVKEFIEEEYYKMESIKLFYETLGNSGIECIKEYIQGYTAEVLYKNYTDDDYIKEFLEERARICLEYQEYNKLKTYAELLYKYFY